VGTPPLPNIPIRSSATPIGTPRGLASPSNLPSNEGSSSNLAQTLLRPGTPASGSDANLWDDIPDEDKAKILRKHLVSRDERQQGSPRGSFSAGSDLESSGAQALHRTSTPQLRLQREDTEPFPVPYHAPGADVT
jgi:solute carrier family 36 (proton-coupled amino acid transporter)